MKSDPKTMDICNPIHTILFLGKNRYDLLPFLLCVNITLIQKKPSIRCIFEDKCEHLLIDICCYLKRELNEQ